MRVLIFLVPVVLALVVLWLVLRVGDDGADPSATVSAETNRTVARIKAIAWDHRDLDPGLAEDLIGRIRVHDADPRRGVLDDLRELAWSARDEAPDLSAIVLDVIRDAEPPALG